MANRDEQEPFLSRWSRMKRGGQSTAPESDAAKPEPAKAVDADPAAETLNVEDEREPLDLETLPKVDELTKESDITAFLDSRVPQMLRNAALSRMWTLDPTIRDFIEVAENQWNWNVPGGAPFYELMEPGSGTGTFVADATSAIYRSVGETASATGSAEIGAGLESGKELVEENAPPSTFNAPQNPATADAEPSAGDPGAVEEKNASFEASSSGVAVEEHSQAPISQLRKRHGGALPA